jgi:hypothetical protein
VKLYLHILLLAVMLGSCSQDPVEVYYDDQRNYYDLPVCMRKQVDLLNKMGKHVRKKLTKDGKSQTVERGDVNWDEELELFMESDINRPAWRGAFIADTVELERMYVISYRTENEEIPVKNVVVTLDRDSKQCLHLTIDRQTDNFLYTSVQKLFFTPGEGYTIKGLLKVSFLFESEFVVESTFIDG